MLQVDDALARDRRPVEGQRGRGGEQRRRDRPSERLRRNVMGAAEQLSEGVQQAWAAVPSLPLDVHLGKVALYR